MEGLLFFVAIIVFIVKTLRKITKGSSGGKKETPRNTPEFSPSPDKLEELIRKMEKSEEPEGGTFFEDISAKDSYKDDEYEENEYETKYYGRNAFNSEDEEKTETFYNSCAYNKTDFTKSDFNYNKTTDDLWDKKDSEKEDLPAAKNEQNNLMHKKSLLRGLSTESKERKKDILSALSEYPELQRAVVFKEILDSPVYKKYY